jgi:hypothetical protein
MGTKGPLVFDISGFPVWGSSGWDFQIRAAESGFNPSASPKLACLPSFSYVSGLNSHRLCTLIFRGSRRHKGVKGQASSFKLHQPGALIDRWELSDRSFVDKWPVGASVNPLLSPRKARTRLSGTPVHIRRPLIRFRRRILEMYTPNDLGLDQQSIGLTWHFSHPFSPLRLLFSRAQITLATVALLIPSASSPKNT